MRCGSCAPSVEFLAAVAHGPEDAQKLLAAGEADRIDGYIVYQMNNWVQVMQTIVASGKPTLVADFPFAGSGGFLVYHGRTAPRPPELLGRRFLERSKTWPQRPSASRF